ncbi:MAG TPA: flagellar hook-length control protein FliK [Tepidisphaeraceae bacterium]|jgi:flagellar hook-length control protein FliK|nr:flagellar hook-length control protein FliK [Tepidisphaeraceae bacterium]
MPQAVSLFPAPPPQPKPPAANPSAADAPSSRFDDALSDAQQKDAPTPPSSPTAAANSTDDVSRPSKTKGSKSSSAKSADTTRGVKPKDDPAIASADEDAKAPAPAAAAASPVSEITDAPAKPKGKNAAKPEHAETAAPADPAANQQIVLPLKKSPDSSADQSAPKGDQPPAKGPAPVEAIDAASDAADPQDAGDADSSSPSAAGARRATAAKPARPNLNGAANDQAPQSAVGVQPTATAGANGVAPAGEDVSASSASDDPTAAPVEVAAVDAKPAAPQPSADHGFAGIFSVAQNPAPAPSASAPPAVHVAVPVARSTPDAQFADSNHPTIVTSVHSTLLPNGGTMRIRLDPPDLGAMDISVQMRNGTMTATFDTSNDQASRMLSHSLGQLKTALEAQGVSVGGLHVQQSPRNSETGSNSRQGEGQNQGAAGDASAQQQEQQRKDMLKRMWNKLNGVEDPLDLVA